MDKCLGGNNILSCCKPWVKGLIGLFDKSGQRVTDPELRFNKIRKLDSRHRCCLPTVASLVLYYRSKKMPLANPRDDL
jgi:hypothetical protein